MSVALWFVVLLAGLVVVAALVNQLAPVHRGRLRRALVLLGVALAAFGLSLALDKEWAARLEITSEIVRLFVVVNLGALLLFLVLMPRVGVVLPVIAGELIAGVGYVVVLFLSLAHHDLDLTGAFATGAVVSAVLAISLQSTLGNILGGVALQLDGSIHEGDWLQFDNGRQGKIRAIRWRHTIVETRDWQTIVVPNAKLLQDNITILGQRDGKKEPQRCWAYFHVDYRFPPPRVVKAVNDGLRGSPIDNVAETPQPNCLCLDFGKDHHQSYANYGVQYWVLDMGRNDSTGSRTRMRIFAALQRAGIPLAIPARMEHLEIHDDARKTRHDQREAEAHFDAINTVELLRFLDDAELRALAEGLTSMMWMAGEVITRQGATAHYLYILTSGSCEIRTKVDPDEEGPSQPLTRKVATLTAPDVFGEMGLVTGEPRTADVVAATDVECYRLDKQTFERVLLARPEIAVELSEKLAERRIELVAVREGLDEAARLARSASERAKILGGIRTFFGL
jgi:CRP-like cAMP-binding protein/small-conductance mechanosensitive channel